MNSRSNSGSGDLQPLTLVQIGLASTGDRDALGDLLNRYGCRVRAWLRQFASLSDADVDDLTQEVHLKILGNLHGAAFPDVRAFRGWVKTICRNTAYNFRRGRGRDPVQRHLESIGRDDRPLDPQDHIRSPASEAQARETACDRSRRIDSLPENDRWLLAAREQRGLTFREIQSEWNERLARGGHVKTVSEDALRVKYHRLLKRIGHME